MMPVFIDKNFSQGWITRQTGAGALTVTGGVLKCTGSGTDSAIRDYYVPVTPGQVVEVEIFARALNGDVRIALDVVAFDGSAVDFTEYVKVTNAEWRKYKLRTTVPYNSTKGFVRLVCGKWASVTTTFDGEYQSPVISVSDGLGNGIVLASGLIRIVSGTADALPSFRAYGIQSVSFNGTDTLTVTLDKSVNPNMRPNIQVTGTPDVSFIPLAGNFTGGASPTFLIKWTNGTAIQNVASLTLYVSILITL